MQLEKELGLKWMIRRVRLLVFLAISTLAADQGVLWTRWYYIVRESFEFEETSSDKKFVCYK